jgi:hypothetical protein
MPMFPLYLNRELYDKVKSLPKGSASSLISKLIVDHFKKVDVVELTEEELRKEILKEEIKKEYEQKLKEINDGTY